MCGRRRRGARFPVRGRSLDDYRLSGRCGHRCAGNQCTRGYSRRLCRCERKEPRLPAVAVRLRRSHRRRVQLQASQLRARGEAARNSENRSSASAFVRHPPLDIRDNEWANVATICCVEPIPVTKGQVPRSVAECHCIGPRELRDDFPLPRTGIKSQETVGRLAALERTLDSKERRSRRVRRERNNVSPLGLYRQRSPPVASEKARTGPAGSEVQTSLRPNAAESTVHDTRSRVPNCRGATLLSQTPSNSAERRRDIICNDRIDDHKRSSVLTAIDSPAVTRQRDVLNAVRRRSVGGATLDDPTSRRRGQG